MPGTRQKQFWCMITIVIVHRVMIMIFLDRKLEEVLPCVPLLLDLIKNDKDLSISTKDLLSEHVKGLTKEGREQWSTTVNPVLMSNVSRTDVESECGNRTMTIALVTITNGLTPNIQEWCFYHLLLGVQRLFIFDHSPPESKERRQLKLALKPFIDEGYVVLLDSRRFQAFQHWTTIEIKSYNHVHCTHRNDYEWMGYIGTDEYVVLHQDMCLADFLGRYSKYAGVALQWNMYSIFGVTTHDASVSIFEQYRHVYRDNAHHLKFFAQSKYVRSVDQHIHQAFEGWNQVNIQENIISGPFNLPGLSREQMFGVAELRHFYNFDWKASLFDKVCGAGEQRMQYVTNRVNAFLGLFHDGAVNVTTDELPLNHGILKKLFFDKVEFGEVNTSVTAEIIEDDDTGPLAYAVC